MFSLKYFFFFFTTFLFFPKDGSVLQQRAIGEKKNIAVYFCGSDWCSSCHKFKNTVLAQPTIDSLLKQGYVFYEADFPQRKKQADSTKTLNDFLAEKLNPNGVFPALVISDENFHIKYAQYGSKANAETVLTHLKTHSQ